MESFPARIATASRETAETRISVSLALDGGPSTSATGLGFLDHMLDLFSRHGGFGIEVSCSGDLHVDDHHTVEDVGIVIGQALREALGDKEHISRYGHAYVPMDEALARAVVDLSGRFALHFDATFVREQVGDLSTEMVEHFFRSLAEHAGMNLHLTVLYGRNDHHKIEALFKATARALRAAVDRNEHLPKVLSTKGIL